MDVNNPVSTFGLILQGGSFAALLYFFLFHEPKRNREWQVQLTTMYENFTRQLQAQHVAASTERELIRADFKAEMKAERDRADRSAKEDRDDCNGKFERLQQSDLEQIKLAQDSLQMMRDTLEIVRMNSADNRNILGKIQAQQATGGRRDSPQSGRT